jgi:hypothetical protein
MPNFHVPIMVDRAVPIYRALLLECERRRQQLGWSMWQLDDAAGLNDGHYAHCLHCDRPTGRHAQWRTLNLIFSALFPAGFDLTVKHKPGGSLSADDMRLKIMFAAADNDRVTRRELMRELGKRGAAARKVKLGKRERKKIARKASKVAAIKRSKAAAAQSKEQSEPGHLSALGRALSCDVTPAEAAE